MKESPVTVLIVEDEILIGIMLARKLRSMGYTVSEIATTGEDAIQRAAEEQPQVILMDITLAGNINGLEAASLIKRKYNIPIIIFTGYDNKQIQDQAKEFNPVAVLSKLGPVTEITKAIDRAVKN